MKLRYAVDFSQLGLDEVGKKTLEQQGHKSVFEGFISSRLERKYPEGLKGQASRIQDSIMRKLDAAGPEFLDLDKHEVEFMKPLLLDDELGVHPRQNRYYRLLAKELQATLDSHKEELEK